MTKIIFIRENVKMLTYEDIWKRIEQIKHSIPYDTSANKLIVQYLHDAQRVAHFEDMEKVTQETRRALVELVELEK